MSNLIRRYERLREKASSPKSVNHGRAAIYSFEKYCKCCKGGMKKPKPFDRVWVRWLFRRGYCSDECADSGGKRGASTGVKGSTKIIRQPKTYDVERMAFDAVHIEKMLRRLTDEQRMIFHADNKYRLLSEKLRFLEINTKRAWSASTFYYKLNRILSLLP